MPKSLISSQLDEKLSQPTSLSSTDGRVSFHLSQMLRGASCKPWKCQTHTFQKGTSSSMPKSLISSQLDENLSQAYQPLVEGWSGIISTSPRC